MHVDNAALDTQTGRAPLAQKVLHADVFVVEVTFILSTAPLHGVPVTIGMSAEGRSTAFKNSGQLCIDRQVLLRAAG